MDTAHHNPFVIFVQKLTSYTLADTYFKLNTVFLIFSCIVKRNYGHTETFVNELINYKKYKFFQLSKFRMLSYAYPMLEIRALLLYLPVRLCR